MKLKDVFKHTLYKLNKEIENHNINHLILDSRLVEKNDLFIAQQGSHVDSHAFAYECLKKGAFVVMNDTSPFLKNITVAMEKKIILVKDTKDFVAPLSKAYFNDPDEHMNIIGLTGTNGKTSTTFMLKTIFEKKGYKVGLIGTINNYIGEKEVHSTNTTPGGFDLYSLLNDMKNAGCQFVVMEISSHALKLGRCIGLNLSTAIFTNVTNEHLDFHITLDSYLQSKLLIFDLLQQSSNPKKLALYNGNMAYKDQVQQSLAKHPSIKQENYGVITQGLGHFTYGGEITDSTLSYNLFQLSYNGQSIPMKTAMPGHFSVENALAAIGCAFFYDIDINSIKEGLVVSTVKGRFENVTPNHPFAVVIDYAHTPDALENILKAAKNLNPRCLTLIFGAGGDRDTTKRTPMGHIASLYADNIYITSDNPRTEDPVLIIEEIAKGIDSDYKGNVFKEVSREKAIKKALLDIQTNDIIIIAGKGHEEYQIFKNETIHFSDQETVMNLIS